MKKRLRNYGLWIAIAAFIPLVLDVFGVGVDLGKWDRIVDGILGILVLAGVISNPTNPNGKGFNL